MTRLYLDWQTGDIILLIRWYRCSSVSRLSFTSSCFPKANVADWMVSGEWQQASLVLYLLAGNPFQMGIDCLRWVTAFWGYGTLASRIPIFSRTMISSVLALRRTFSLLHMTWLCPNVDRERRIFSRELLRQHIPFHQVFLLGGDPLVLHKTALPFLHDIGFFHNIHIWTLDFYTFS